MTRRVVIYRLGSLGDTVVALPCLHKVAATFPDAERIVLTNVPVMAKAAPLNAILGGSGLIHGTIAYPVGTRSIGALWQLAKQLRALEADTLVYLTPPRGLKAAWRDRLYFALCGFGRIVGTPLSEDLQHNRIGPDGLVEPECERLARCIAPLGPVDLDDRASWDMHLTAEEKALGRAALAPIAGLPRIAINMGGKVVENDWGQANWLALIGKMRESCAGHALLIIGAQEDSPRAEAIAAEWGGPVLNACGQLAPRVSAAAMQGSRFFVGHDSGPLHLAAAMGVTCIGLFGDKNVPRKWHPHGRQHRIVHEMRGVQAITVDRVEAEVEAELRGPKT